MLTALRKDDYYEMELVLTRKSIAFKEILNLDIKIHIIERRFFKKDPSLFFRFFKIARKFKPDLIHVWGNMVAIYAIPAKIMLRIPMANNQITDAPTNVPGGLLSHKLPFFFSDIIISNSKAGLKSYKSPENKSLVICNGFNFTRITSLRPVEAVRKEFSIKTKYIVGMVASFSKLKDYKTYIEAANIVLKKHPDVTFLCVGSGDDSVYRTFVDFENKSNIIFTGRQDDVESIMNCCTIGVLSTFTEGISNALMEFMALGKPVIASGSGGTPELIENRISGLIIEQENPERLALAIMDLLDNPGKMDEMGKLAKKRIELQFSMENMLKSFVTVYDYFDKKTRGIKSISGLVNG